MKQFLEQSLKYKLLMALLVMGLIPYLFIMSYFSYWGRASIIEHQNERYQLQAEQSKQLIESRLSQLIHEITFISHLEVFDDIIASDVDERISQLLAQKADISEIHPLKLYVLDTTNHIISSSQNISTAKTYPLYKKEHYIQKGILHLVLPIYASFDKRFLGYLVAQYPLSNFKRFMINNEFIHYYLSNKHIKNYNLVKLHGILEDYSLYYTVNEQTSLAFINTLMLYLSLLLIVGVTLIFLVSHYLSKQITSPILALTQASKEIISTKNYALRVDIKSHDEIGILSVMFNNLIQTIESALQALSMENKLRTKRFIDLTDTFNAITSSTNQEECIELSIKKLHSILPYSMSFSSTPSTSKKELSLPLYITDCSTQQKAIYGYLLLDDIAYKDKDEQRFFTSVTSMIALQIERINMIDKIQSASEAKSAFISGMSHELRTPLSAIIGFSQYLISYEELETDQIATIAKIEKAALHLLDIINDILDISKIEAGKMELTITDVAMDTLLLECIDITSSLAKDKNLQLHADIKEIESLHIRSDAKLCKQIIINLLSNAIKFTPHGSVTLVATKENTTLTINITDTGVGLSKENLKKVFDEFTQLKNSAKNRQRGTGLGLSLSQHIAHALNAKLTLQSKGEGLGSKAILVFNI